MLKRSIFNNGANLQLSAIMELEQHRPTQRLKDWSKRKLHRCGGSQLVEDGINRQRRSEKDASSSIMSADRSFAVLVEKKVLGSVHHYKEVQCLCDCVGTCVPLPCVDISVVVVDVFVWFKSFEVDHTKAVQTRIRKLAKSVYKPCLTTAQKTIDWKAVTGFSATTSWNSPGASSLINATLDMELCNFLDLADKWDDIDKCWWSCLLQDGPMVVKKIGDLQWYLTLFEAAHVGITWPVELLMHSSTLYWSW